jgi:hypothetical protein
MFSFHYLRLFAIYSFMLCFLTYWNKYIAFVTIQFQFAFISSRSMQDEISCQDTVSTLSLAARSSQVTNEQYRRSMSVASSKRENVSLSANSKNSSRPVLTSIHQTNPVVEKHDRPQWNISAAKACRTPIANKRLHSNLAGNRFELGTWLTLCYFLLQGLNQSCIQQKNQKACSLLQSKRSKRMLNPQWVEGTTSFNLQRLVLGSSLAHG